MTETAHTPLPCPFCGGEAKTVSPLGFGNVRAIECCNSDDCAATGPWACNEAEALTAWNTRADSHHRLVEALEAARKIIADIDDYMKRPSRGDWGEECACCMGELLDDDRDAIAKIDAALKELGR